MKGFTGTWIHVFLPSFMEIGKAQVTKWVHHKKGWYFVPLSVASGAILPEISLFPIHLPNFIQICQVFEKTYPNMFRGLIKMSLHCYFFVILDAFFCL